MFKIDNNKNIHITRGDIGTLVIKAKDKEGQDYTFEANDVLRLGIFVKGKMNNIVLQKDVTVSSSSTSVEISLTSEDTRIGDLINKPVNYWYEVQLNPDTNPQTIIGYDEEGAKLFILYPEGVEEE